MPITITPHNPAWPANFHTLRAPIAAALNRIPCAIEHVGSTAVQGLAAKPIIDITIALESADDLRATTDRLATLGYRHLGDLGITDRHAYRIDNPAIPHHLYAGPRNAPSIRNHIALRDLLRARPDLRGAYAALKHKLIADPTLDIDQYTESKSAFIAKCLALCGFSTTELTDITNDNRAS